MSEQKFDLEQLNKIFIPIFDAALKYSGVQIDNNIQAAKGVLGSLFTEEPPVIKEETDEQEDND